MKRIIVILLLALICVTGCASSYQVGGKTLRLDQDIDFRHLHYTTSNDLDFGSEKTYRFYDLYDKKPNVIYRVAVYQMAGDAEAYIKSLEEGNKDSKTTTKKYNSKKWTLVSYKREDQTIHAYVRSYDGVEFYQIEFVNVEKGTEFEKAFMSTVRMDTK